MTSDCPCLTLGLPCGCVRPGPGGYSYRPHGTLAAARRHYRRGETACRACRQAQARAWQDRRARPGRNRPVPAEAGLAAGRQIREMRHWAGMTQQALGCALGVTQTAVSGWERGEYGSGPALLARVAAVTGYPAPGDFARAA